MRTKSWMFGIVAACGGAESGGVDTQVQAYQAARGDLATAVQTYQSEASTASTTDACQAAQARYGAAAGPALERMRQMSGALAGDGQHMGGTSGMGMTGGMGMQSGGADLSCGVAAMTTELARHQAVACAGDALANHAEMQQHLCQMSGWLEQQRVRCQAMLGEGTGPGACLANPDGTYAMGACADGTACPYACDGTAGVQPATAP
ncbi:hypothetical protein [Anaeromyxobacter sp. SG64]|uniref:hypothetical protein n=1 Tax=Anaeromyxobacter sp. SG64 TaxID=2925409 RepID=UPI001F585CC7|nr:hypothetical protein [Anaeromyxobacter sp. SG64]